MVSLTDRSDIEWYLEGHSLVVPARRKRSPKRAAAPDKAPSTVPWNKGRTLPAEVLNPEEVRALLGACSVRAPTGIRNRALFAVLYRAQLRIGEALALHPKDLDRQNGTIRILHGKGDKARLVGLDDGAWALIDLWLVKRKELGISGRRPVFCTLNGALLQPSYCRSLAKRLAARAGIDKRVHPHGLRHTGAFELANEGHPLHVIQQQLGHSSLATTDRYIRHLAPKEVVDAMRSRTWKP